MTKPQSQPALAALRSASHNPRSPFLRSLHNANAKTVRKLLISRGFPEFSTLPTKRFRADNVTCLASFRLQPSALSLSLNFPFISTFNPLFHSHQTARRSKQSHSAMSIPWHIVSNIADIPSPALLVYPDRIRENIRRAIAIVGDPSRLRPHIKTHKCGAVIRMHLDLDVTKFKCATIAEAEMAASAGARDVFLAAQLVGPNLRRFAALRRKFQEVEFST